MAGNKSIIANLVSRIRTFAGEPGEGNWQSVFHASCKKLMELDYRSKASRIWLLVSGLLTKKPEKPKPIRPPVSTLRVATHQAKELPPEPQTPEASAGEEALALAQERYARDNHAQLAERRRVLEAQWVEVSEQMKRVDARQREVHAELTAVLAQQAALEELEKSRKANGGHHPANNLYG